MKLEKQLACLRDLGLLLADGVTVDDLLYSFDRNEYEDEPYDLVLFALGCEVEREPWGRFACIRAWNFDTECINSPGDYVNIVKRLTAMTGDPNYLIGVGDSLDFEKKEGWIEYIVNGVARRWDLEVNDDWADTVTLNYVMADLERDSHHFYVKDNGQAMILFYLASDPAARLNGLSGNALSRVTE